MSIFTDQHYLQTDQYKNHANLNARIQLHQRFSTNPYGWMNWVFDHLKLPDRCRVLDLGCGPCDLWESNRTRIVTGWEITLADFSPGMLRQGRQKLDRSPHAFAFVVSDAQDIPFPNATFDAVVANHMLYHVPDRARALAEIHRVLKPGGRLLAATNGVKHMRQVRELVGAIDPDSEMGLAADTFGLENGSEQLEEFFPQVTLQRYSDDLSVTEIEPLVAYILSTNRSASLKQHPHRLVRLVREQMKREGVLHITKDSGLFEAQKGNG